MRRYSPREMSEILKLAEELREPGRTSNAESYSLSEMQAVAGEMGMDPSKVALAVAQYESGRRVGDKRDRWRHQFVREIPFVVTDSGWERMVDQMRSQTGGTGTIRERADGSQEWTSSMNGETVVMTLTHDGSTSLVNLMVTRVDAGWIVKMMWGIAFFMTTLIGTGASSKGGFTGPEIIILLTVLATGLAALPALLNFTSSRAENRFRSLADKLEAAALMDRPSPMTMGTRVVADEQPVNELRA